MTGLTRRERAVLDLWDEGLGSRAIAARLGLKDNQVRQYLAAFASGDAGQTSRDVAAGSASLLAALRRHHPDRVAERA